MFKDFIVVFRLCFIAKVILNKRKNFVHDLRHAKRVYQNNLEIMKNLKYDKSILKLASFWHDTGKSDWKEESIPHQELSARLFKTFASKLNLNKKKIKTICRIILSHRNRGVNSNFFPKKRLEKAFWDADKLDIFNVKRTKYLLKLYQNGVSAGEFNRKDSLNFWKEINISFSDKFFLKTSRTLFIKKFKKFSSFIQRIPE